MSEKTSRLLLIFEFVFIVLPLSALAIWASVVLISEMLKNPEFSNGALGLLAFLSLLAIGSGWRLFVAFFRKGVNGLRIQSLVWWVMIITGVLILVGALISYLFPLYLNSKWFEFRINFSAFAFGLPLLIPLCHLAFERFSRKSSS